MQPADGKRFRELLRAMNRVLAVQSGAELDGPMLDVYWLALRDWPLADFESACAHLMRTAQFMPKPADFTALRRADCDTAGEAWSRAINQARDLPVSGGYLQEVPTGDPLLDAAVRAIGGYRAIANASERDLQFLGQRFAEHFEQIGEREEIREAMPQIAGEPRQKLPALSARALPYDAKRRLS